MSSRKNKKLRFSRTDRRVLVIIASVIWIFAVCGFSMAANIHGRAIFHNGLPITVPFGIIFYELWQVSKACDKEKEDNRRNNSRV